MTALIINHLTAGLTGNRGVWLWATLLLIFSSVAVGASNNISPFYSAITFSSQNTKDGQLAAKAVDGVVDGWPGDYTKEWATVGGKAGSWIRLDWSSAYTVDHVVLYDRPNLNDQVLSGTLLFSDGTSVPVGSLPDDGTGLTVTFGSRTVTWVRFTVNTVKSTTFNIGLAELQVFGDVGGGTNTAPTITTGPTATPSDIGEDQTSQLSVTASDPDGDVLTYLWQPASGTITGSGASVTFNPPAVTADTLVRINLTVSDPGGLSATGYVDVMVRNVGGGSSSNISPFYSAITFSSQNTKDGQLAAKAVDGVVDGWPGDYTKEWATVGGKAGSWIRLDWSSAYTVDHVVLYDRPNLNDQVLSGTLLFSDGTSVPVGSLPDDGTGLTVTFGSRTVTWVRFTVNTVKSTTFNIGLAELQVFGDVGGGTNTAPTITTGPTATPSDIGEDQTSQLSVTASDPDGDVLTYLWQPASGTITGSGASVTFNPPAVTADTLVRINLTVSDPGGLSATGYVDVMVHNVGDSVLIVAPHPDDDVIIAAGVATAALARGDTVKIIYMTNGDFLGVSQGLIRQSEAVNGQVNYLGLTENDLMFLGYPDHDLDNIFLNFSNSTDQLDATNGTNQTYGNRGLGNADYHTYRFGGAAAYNRFNILVDLEDILTSLKPGHIITTAEEDHHADHSATYQLLQMAIANVMAADPSYQPIVYKTIVHAGNDRAWPLPADPTAYMSEPPNLTATTPWSERIGLDVPRGMQNPELLSNQKHLAVISHESQLATGFILKFVHKDEYFWLEAPNSVNQPPRVTAGVDQSVEQGQSVQLDGTLSVDPDSDPMSFQWTQVSGVPVTLQNANSATPSFVAPVSGNTSDSLEFELSVSDGTFTSLPDRVIVRSIEPPPLDSVNITALATTAIASSENVSTGQTAVKAIDGIVDGWPGDYTKEWATEGEQAGAYIELNWSSAYQIYRVVLYDRPNNDDQITSATLSFSDGSTVAVGLLDNGGAATEVTFPGVVSTSVRLTVTGTRATSHNIGLAEMEVYGAQYSGTNLAPTANAGADQFVAEGAVVSLDGSGSGDPNGDALSYQWSQTGGPAVTLSDTTAVVPSFTAPSGLSADATLIFSLVVNDGQVSSAADAVTVTVQAAGGSSNTADLAVSMLVDNPNPTEGGTVVYTVTVMNEGPANATGVEILDTLPIELTYVSDDAASTATSYDNGTGIWTVSALASSASISLNITATFNAGASIGPVANTASVNNINEMDPVSSNDSASVLLFDFEWPTLGWTISTPAEVNMDQAKLEAARDYALTGGGSGYITRGGKLVLSWGDVTQRYELKSSTKSIGVTVLGLALQDNLVSLNDLATVHYPEIGNPPMSNTTTGWLNEITLMHLATATAGFDFPGGYSDLLSRPGTTWNYSDSGANWLADTLTVLYGQDLNTLMFDRVFTPLGITATDLTWRDNAYRNDTINGVKSREFASGITANVDAMARIGYLYLRKGQWDGQTILPENYVKQAGQPVASIQGLPVNDPANYFNASDHYGLLWWNNGDGSLAGVPTDTYWSWGLYSSLIVVIPSLDIVATRAGNEWYSDWNGDYSRVQPFILPIVQSVLASGVNLAPTANAGADQFVAEGAVVSLDGSGSGDPNGDALSYQWSQTGGPAVTLSDTTAVAPSFTAPSGLSADATLIFSLVVNDGQVSSAADTVTVTVQVAGSNIAGLADVTVSSESVVNSQLGIRAIDGIVDGWPGDYTKEWATEGEQAGAYIELNWSSAYQIYRVVLYDRPNNDDQITSATLSFSDGSTVAVGLLDNGGAATEVTFPGVVSTSVRLTVTGTRATSHNIGLAEMEVYGAQYSGTNLAPTANAGADQFVAEGAVVSLDGSGSGDPNGDALSYQWSQTGGPAVTLSDTTAVVPSFTAPSGLSADATLIFSLVVNDGQVSSNTDAVNVTVLNGPELPAYYSHYWQLDGTGSVYSDTAVAGVDATCTNCPTATSGNIGGAQQFNGVTTELNAIDSDTVEWGANDSFTIKFWLQKSSACAEQEAVVGRKDLSGSMEWWVGCAGGNAAFLLTDNAGASVMLNGTSNIDDGVWHHITAVRDGFLGVNRLYVDGVLEASSQIDYIADFSGASTDINIGWLNDGASYYHFDGAVDELALMTRVPSQDEINRDYNDGTVGLGIGYWGYGSRVQIMPLGDSITVGSHSEATGGYRGLLISNLGQGGYDFTFVGSQSDIVSDHEGHSGYTPTDISSFLASWLTSNHPEVILLHIGTNGLVSSDPSGVENILNIIHDFDANITVVLARIINMATYDALTTEFNDNVVAMAQNRIAAGYKIIVVDMESALDYAVDMSDDGLHPNTAGYSKMAGVWGNGLHSFMPASIPVAPTISSSPLLSAAIGTNYSYQVRSDSYPLPQYSLTTAPAGMTIHPYTGEINWSAPVFGSYDVSVSVSNGVGTATQSYTIQAQ